MVTKNQWIKKGKEHTIASPCAIPPMINLEGSFTMAGGGAFGGGGGAPSQLFAGYIFFKECGKSAFPAPKRF